jgi:glucose/arabinose dehydrogenase/cytochrome c2
VNIRQLFVISAALLPGFAAAQDATAGKDFFAQQCALCHSAAEGDNGGAQGPLLHGVFGRAAAATGFTYTDAMRNSGLTWDAATLDRFLASPTTLVPGSSMVIPVDNAGTRANVIAYFEQLANGTFVDNRPAPRGFGGFANTEPPSGDPDWINDRPGRVHRVDLDSLPEPYQTSSAVNFPSVVARPDGANLMLPDGFTAEVFLDEGLSGPRAMVLAPNGDIFLAETQSGRVRVIRPNALRSAPQTIEIFAQGMLQPLGIAFYPAGDNPEWVYVAETNRVIRYPYQVGDMLARDVPEVIVPQLSPVGGGHYTRDLAFSPDGKYMYVSVGSQSNVAENNMDEKSAAEIAAWEAEKGLGATWGTEENRASVMVFEVGNEAATGRLFANGIRNCVGLTMQPQTGSLWCSVNERDQLGDDLVPDYSTRVTDGSFFGWPWYYMGDNEDPRHAGARPDLVGKITRPDVPYTAHSAAVDLEFYPLAPAGNSAFPAEYAGDGFAVLHGSWNRAHRTGHKIVRLPMEDGIPTGEYIDFLVGFIDEEGNPWGRPVATQFMDDGSMLLSDDGANVIYRISFSR